MALDTRTLFSVRSDEYAAARPRYPRKLFEHLAGLCRAHDRAWDCATGSGQAAIALTDWFSAVEATDVSPQQLAHAAAHERIHYSVQPAERTDFPDRHFDLVTVAQALHWFNFDQFWPEVHRVLRPGGIFATWTYTLPQLSPTLDPIIEIQLLKVIKSYWAPQNQLAWDGYASVPFPFQELAMPAITMRLDWNLPQFIAYVGTWSATRLCLEANGAAFFESFRQSFAAAWGDPHRPRPVTLEFFCRVGRHREDRMPAIADDLNAHPVGKVSP